MDFIEPCFGIGHNLSLICQMTSEDIKHQLIIIIISVLSVLFNSLLRQAWESYMKRQVLISKRATAVGNNWYLLLCGRYAALCSVDNNTCKKTVCKSHVYGSCADCSLLAMLTFESKELLILLISSLLLPLIWLTCCWQLMPSQPWRSCQCDTIDKITCKTLIQS